MDQMDALRVLYVEDNYDHAKIVQLILNKEGVEVFHVASLQAALDWLAMRTVDLILLDLRLRDTDDTENLARINLAMPKTPIIVLSAFAPPKLVDALQRLGAAAVLDKGTAPDTLIRTVQDVMRRARESEGGLHLIDP